MKRGTQVPVKLQQWFNIFFAQQMGISMSMTVKAIQYVYGNNALGATQIRHWFRQFKSGRNCIVDLPRKPKERTGRTPANIAKVKALLDQDRRHSITCLSANTGIPWSTCRKIVRWDLELVQRSAKFVPHLLKEGEMQKHLRISGLMLDKLRTEPDFLSTVITMDES